MFIYSKLAGMIRIDTRILNDRKNKLALYTFFWRLSRITFPAQQRGRDVWGYPLLLGRFYVIDFEYGAYGYRGYDLGNHFNEYAGFDCDYSL